MNMPDWIDEFKSSVSWGDQIEPYQEREFDFPVLTVVLEHGGRHFWIEANLSELSGLPRKINLLSSSIKSSDLTVIFTDKELVAKDIESLMHYTKELGCGIDFLSVNASVIRNGLLLLYSEGTILDPLFKTGS